MSDQDTLTSNALLIDREHPWPWLEAFTEAAQDFFNGRDEDVEALQRCVLAAPATVLFGKSGLGKTSLVQAGLAPRLRQRRLLPVLLRVDHGSSQPVSAQLLNRLNAAVEAAGLRWQGEPRPEAERSSPVSQLWEQLHDAEVALLDAQGKRWTPVFVLDQFEEAFTLIDDGERRQRLFAELGNLIEGRIPPEVAQRLDAHDELLDRINADLIGARYILSLREDYLADLEVWADRIPRLGPNRCRLLPMKPRQALDAVQKTGGALVTTADAQRIVDFLGKQSQQGSASRQQWIEPALLSLICAGLNQHRLDNRKAQLDTSALDQLGSQLLERFYDSAFAALPKERRAAAEAFVEGELITADGTRRPFPRDAAERAGLSAADLATLTHKRLLRIDNTEVGDFVELVHDRLAVIAAQRAKLAAERAERLEADKRRKQKNRWLASTGLSLLLVMGGFTGWAMKERDKAEQAAEAAAESASDAKNQARLANHAEARASEQAAKAAAAAASEAQAASAARDAEEKAYDAQRIADRQRREAEDQRRTAEKQRREATEAREEARSAKDIADLQEAVARENAVAALAAETKASAEAVRALTAERKATAARHISDSRNLLAGVTNGSTLSNLPGCTAAATASPSASTASAAIDNSPNRFEQAMHKLLQAHGLDLESVRKDAPIALDELAPGFKWSNGLSDEAQGLAFSPDGLHLVVAYHNRSLQILDARTGQPTGPLMQGHQATVYAVAYSPDGRLIASAGKDGTVRLWDSLTSEAVGSVLQGHRGAVTSLAFSPDGTQLVSGGYDRTLRRWNTCNWQPIGTALTGHAGAITSVVYSGDGLMLISGSSDQSVRRWDARSGTPLGEPMRSTSAITSLAFAPASLPAQFVTGNEQGQLQRWKVGTGSALSAPMQMHAGTVRSVTFSPDGRYLVSGGDDQILRWHDTRELQLITQINSPEPIRQLAYSPESARIAWVGRTTAQLWNASDIRQLSNAVTVDSITSSSAVTSLLAFDAGRQLVTGHQDGSLRLWQIETRGLRRITMQRAHNGPVLALARSTGSESWLVSGGRDGHLQRWSLVGLNPLGAAWKAHSDAINSLSIDPTGKTLVSASEDGTLRRWNALTGDALGVPMQGHAGPVYSVAFSPDGQRVLSGGADTSLRLWNAQTGSAVEGPLQRHSAAVTAVSFDPTNSSRAASASRDGTILVWDVNQRIPVRPALRGHAGPIYSLDVSASGRELFTAGADTTIRIWDRRSGRPLLQPLSGHQVDIQRVLALPDATDLRLVSADRQGELRLWRIQRPPSDWPKRLCAHLLHRSETCTSSSSTEP